MSFIGGLMNQGVAWFTKWMVTPPGIFDLRRGRFDDFGRWESRLQRYDLFWAYYTNSAYDATAHVWGGTFKSLYSLYRYTRGCYNPFYRLGEFWGTTTWGGKLDASQQGGRAVQSAIPILTDDPDIRAAIDKLWRDSEWQANKQIVARAGAVAGDVGIRVWADQAKGVVRLWPVDASDIRWIRKDPQGNVTDYELWTYRWDPEYDPRTMNFASPGAGEQAVVYIEKCTKQDEGVYQIETFRNYEPYGWYGQPQKWTVELPFVPLVVYPHVKYKFNYYWGLSEYQAGFTKAREVDDIASKQHDHIRMASDPKWFLAGVQKPKGEPATTGEDPSPTNPQPGRQEAKFLYGGQGATAVPMVFPVDNQFVSIEIQNQLTSMEKDYPELRYDSARAAGDASAKALREVRKGCEAKVHDRRANHDAGLLKAMQMALALGGELGFPGYEGFRAQQFVDGDLKFSIGERAVFLMDPLDLYEEEQAVQTLFQTAKTANFPAELLMRRLDFSQEEINEYHAAQQKEQQQAIEHAGRLAQATAPPEPSKDAPPSQSAA